MQPPADPAPPIAPPHEPMVPPHDAPATPPSDYEVASAPQHAPSPDLLSAGYQNTSAPDAGQWAAGPAVPLAAENLDAAQWSPGAHAPRADADMDPAARFDDHAPRASMAMDAGGGLSPTSMSPPPSPPPDQALTGHDAFQPAHIAATVGTFERLGDLAVEAYRQPHDAPVVDALQGGPVPGATAPAPDPHHERGYTVGHHYPEDE